MSNLKGVGIDIVDVSRFEKFNSKISDPFIKKVFFEKELGYCFSFKNPAPHLAGTFSAKEAVSKALGIKLFPFSEIEIRHGKDGEPVAFHKGKKLSVNISITHTDTVAAAIAVA